MRQISVSTDVFATIWANRRAGEDTEDTILRRVLSAPTVTIPSSGGQPQGSGVRDSRNGVSFPEGFQIFRFYKGREYRAAAVNGAWQRTDTMKRYATLNQLNGSIAEGNENVWTGNWKFKDAQGAIRSINVLRLQGRE